MNLLLITLCLVFALAWETLSKDMPISGERCEHAAIIFSVQLHLEVCPAYQHSLDFAVKALLRSGCKRVSPVLILSEEEASLSLHKFNRSRALFVDTNIITVRIGSKLAMGHGILSNHINMLTKVSEGLKFAQSVGAKWALRIRLDMIVKRFFLPRYLMSDAVYGMTNPLHGFHPADNIIFSNIANLQALFKHPTNNPGKKEVAEIMKAETFLSETISRLDLRFYEVAAEVVLVKPGAGLIRQYNHKYVHNKTEQKYLRRYVHNVKKKAYLRHWWNNFPSSMELVLSDGQNISKPYPGFDNIIVRRRSTLNREMRHHKLYDDPTWKNIPLVGNGTYMLYDDPTWKNLPIVGNGTYC